MFSPCRYEYNIQFGAGLIVPEDTVMQVAQISYTAAMMDPSFFLITAYRTGSGTLNIWVEFIDLSNNTVIARIPSTGTISLTTLPTNYNTEDVLYVPPSTSIGIVVNTIKQGAAKSNANILSMYMR